MLRGLCGAGMGWGKFPLGKWHGCTTKVGWVSGTEVGVEGALPPQTPPAGARGPCTHIIWAIVEVALTDELTACGAWLLQRRRQSIKVTRATCEQRETPT